MNKQPIAKVSTSQVGWGVVATLVLLVVSTTIAAPQYINRGIDWVNGKTNAGLPTAPVKNFRLGLDLQGGVQLIYQADLAEIKPGQEAEAVEGVRDVIERRVNGMGVGEATVQTSQVEKKYRLNVELPGVTNVAEAIKMIGETPILEFKEQAEKTSEKLTLEQSQKLAAYNASAKTKAEGLLNKIKAGDSFDSLVVNSEDTLSQKSNGNLGYIVNLNPVTELYAWAKTAKAGDVSQTLIVTPEGYNIAKRGGEKDGQPEVKASHILVCYLGSKNCDSKLTKDEARAKAEGLAKTATAKNFAQLAKTNSTDPGTKDKGGDLGFFSKEQMIPAFAEAAFGAKDGAIVGPIESEYGFHVIYRVAARQEKQYEVSRILVATQSEANILGASANWKTTGLSGKQLEKAQVVTDQRTGAVQVSLQFNTEGAQLFKDITQRNLNKPVAIFLDNQPISVPNVNSVIPNGQAVISGNFTLLEAKLLAQRLNAGALPVPVELVSQQSISAPLGQAALAKSLFAGLVGAAIIAVFMTVIYRLPGLVSVFSLGLYIAISLALYKLIGITITLAGIAGFIMSLGVAVDANVLIFERMKEELKSGKPLSRAIEEGFLRAWTSIRDGNLSTLITCVILIWFGTSFVKGFAVTLSLGILVSMFTAITVTRTLLRFIAPRFKNPNGGWIFLSSSSKN